MSFAAVRPHVKSVTTRI